MQRGMHSYAVECIVMHYGELPMFTVTVNMPIFANVHHDVDVRIPCSNMV